MTDLFDNPMGLCGFEFVEFSAPERGVLEPVFEMMGFSEIAKHRSKDAILYRQGDINYLRPAILLYHGAGLHPATLVNQLLNDHDLYRVINYRHMLLIR